MKSKAFLIGVIVVLVLLNLGTLTFMWINRPHKPHQGKVIDPVMYLAKKLHLDDSQRAAFGQMRIVYRAGMSVLEHRDRNLHKKFFDQVLITEADSAIAQTLADSIAATRMKMELLTLNHFTELRKLLHEKQRQNFDSLFFDALRVALPPPPPPPPPPPADNVPGPPPPPPLTK